ncbi:MAG: hypothetical protein JHC93_08020 [Parachlamydiales bacterium]|nr:hypothetical protein [Parachlamydiales bacterium]
MGAVKLNGYFRNLERFNVPNLWRRSEGYLDHSAKGYKVVAYEAGQFTCIIDIQVKKNISTILKIISYASCLLPLAAKIITHHYRKKYDFKIVQKSPRDLLIDSRKVKKDLSNQNVDHSQELQEQSSSDRLAQSQKNIEISQKAPKSISDVDECKKKIEDLDFKIMEVRFDSIGGEDPKNYINDIILDVAKLFVFYYKIKTTDNSLDETISYLRDSLVEVLATNYPDIKSPPNAFTHSILQEGVLAIKNKWTKALLEVKANV